MSTFFYGSEMLCTFLNRDSNVFLVRVFPQQTIDFSVKEGQKSCWYSVSYEQVFVVKGSNFSLVPRLKVLACLLENHILKWL